MRILILMASLILGSNAMAADGRAFKNDASGFLGVARGGITIGAAFEHLMDGSQGVGGQLHLYQKDSGDKHATDGYLIVGGFTGYHFYKGSWDFALSPGLNIIDVSGYNDKRKDETDFGPSVQISLTQAVTDRVSVGFDFAEYFIWTGDARGNNLSDLDAKVKIGF